jgi:leader peptidase (prepilin peptidase) / N-methyltransferase
LNTRVLEAISEAAVAVPAAGLAGLFVGSFLNVVVYRAPRGLSVVAPRSFCPTCQRQLEWWENVPLVSWILLRARCHSCHHRISARYPLVELLTGIAFAFVTWEWHGTAPAVGYCALAATMLAVACIEYDGLRAPLSISAVGAGGAEIALFVAAGIDQRWRLGVGSAAGLVIGVAAYSVLRSRDPKAVERLGHGRSALLVAGSWIGGLGAVAIVVGTASSIGIYLACILSVRISRTSTDVRSRGDRGSPALPPVVAVPLVTAIGVGLVVSLIIAR